MPIYDYKCLQCNDKFTMRVAISEREQIKCPSCNGATKQILTGINFAKKSNSTSSTKSTSCTPRPGCGSTCSGCGS